MQQKFELEESVLQKDEFDKKHPANVPFPGYKGKQTSAQKDEFANLRTTYKPASNKPFSGFWVDSVALKKEASRLQKEAEKTLNPLSQKLETLSPEINVKVVKYKENLQSYEKDVKELNVLSEKLKEKNAIFEKSKSEYERLKNQYEKNPESVSYDTVDRAYKEHLKNFDSAQALKDVIDAKIDANKIIEKQNMLKSEGSELQKISDDFNKSLNKYNEGIKIYKQSLENVRYADRFNIMDDFYKDEWKKASASDTKDFQ